MLVARNVEHVVEWRHRNSPSQAILMATLAGRRQGTLQDDQQAEKPHNSQAAPSFAAAPRGVISGPVAAPRATTEHLPRRNLGSGLAGGRLCRSSAVRISSYFRSL